jgi:hypothetical protein
MKVVFHEDFKTSYTLDPAGGAGREGGIQGGI